MNNLASILLLALLPAAGNVLGSAAAELTRTPRWLVGAALHAAAGVAIALVAVELMPRVTGQIPTWLFLLLFGIGGLAAYFLSRAALWVSRRVPGGSKGAWMVYMATAADLFGDGLMTGAGAAVSSELGLLLALSQVIANIPGGFATLANFRAQEVPRRARLLAAGSFALPVLIGAAAGFLALRGAGPTAQSAALAVIVGMLLITTVEDLVPQADKPGAARNISTASFVAGFAFFVLLSSYVG